MEVSQLQFGKYRKNYAFDNASGLAISPIDDLLALAVGKFGIWESIPPLTTRKIHFSGGGSPFMSTLASNEYVGVFSIGNRPSRKFNGGVVPTYNHEGRCVSLIDPAICYDDYGLAQPVADLASYAVSSITSSCDVTEVCRMCLNYASEAGWLVCANFAPLQTQAHIVDRKSGINGIIRGACENWVDALVIATLTSGGFFVCVGPDDDTLHPGMAVAATFGTFPICRDDITGNVGVAPYVVDEFTYHAELQHDRSVSAYIQGRTFSHSKKPPFFRAPNHNPFSGLTRQPVILPVIGNAMYHYVPSDAELDSVQHCDSYSVNVDDLVQMCNLPFSTVMGTFDNIFYGSVPKSGLIISNECVDDFKSGLRDPVIDDRRYYNGSPLSGDHNARHATSPT